MSTYPGNASLSSAVKDRVLSTFQQAIALYKQGRTDEVAQGCDLILRMDPMFDPAKKLLEKTKNPSAPIDIDALLPAGSASDPLSEARTALAARDFQRANDLTAELLRNDFTNEEARVVNDTAREKLEAIPFVDQFIRKAETFARQGNSGAARAELDKARALDADHPGIRQIADSLTASESAAPPPSFSSGGSPSFVVDTPTAAPAARGAAQATDFGFTFEEEKSAAPEQSFDAFRFDAPAPQAPVSQPAAPTPFGSGGFSFDAPAPAPAPTPSMAPPPAAESGGFDFSTAPTATSGDDQKKIQQYLTDGDRAATAGDYQQAIDLWSRIFLIDVTNDEASQRIENAKAKRREIESQVEALISAGELAYGRDDETARAKFSEALRLDPGNVTAHDNLERMTNTVAEGGAAGYEVPFAAPPPARADIFEDDIAMSGSYDSLKSQDSIPAKKVVKAKLPAAPAPAKQSSSMGVVATIAGVVIAAALGWFLWSKYMAKPSYDPTTTMAAFHQAEALAGRGRFDEAIAKLGEVKPADPQHDKALEMIADLQHKKSQAAETVNGRPAAVVYNENLAAGRTAFEGHDYDSAKKAFDSAARIKALPPDMKVMYDSALQQSAKLEGAKSLFTDQKYQEAIANLDPLLQADPQNQSTRRMLVGAHFNLGAIALQEERLPDAVREFDNVLKNDPNDVIAKRSKELAERYAGQPKDLLYKIYVKYLPLRKMT
jgi:tetratricopeptide (TPR) repeat protein